MVGSVSPWLIQPLPCPWNYHTWTVLSGKKAYFGTKCIIGTKFEILPRCHLQCRPARFEMSEIPRMRESGKNMCPEAESEGVGFLHGNSQVASQRGSKPKPELWCSRHSPLDETPLAKASMVMQYLELCFSFGRIRYLTHGRLCLK